MTLSSRFLTPRLNSRYVYMKLFSVGCKNGCKFIKAVTCTDYAVEIFSSL